MARPRKHPEGTTAADRKRASRDALLAAGGSIKQFALSARASESLAMIRRLVGDPTDTAVIERLLEDERRRMMQRTEASGPKTETD